MIKNGEYEGIVCGLGTEGEGIVKTEGTTAFVPFCLVGEEVKFKALKVKGNIAYGKLLKVNNPSPSRKSPPCPAFGKCGGCGLQHMDYAAQLAFKRETVKTALRKLGGIYAEVSPCVPCDREFRYRNKLVLPIGGDGKGGVVCGFYAPRSHRIVPVSDCLIQADWVKKVIGAVINFAAERHIPPYEEGKGILRHIVVRAVGDKYIFALVCTKQIDVTPLICLLESCFNDFTFLLNVNNSDTNVIFGEEWHICRGEGFLEAEENGVKFTVGANTFIQVNDGVREKLYSRILSEVNAGDVAIDLYSGGGMLTAMLAKKCGKAYGIEIVAEASRCADELRDNNGLSGKMFNVCGAVEDNLEVISKGAGGRGVIICDPPRKGMERSVVNAIRQSGAGKVVLVSCNPATLARDLGLLTGTLALSDGALVKCDNPDSPYDISEIIPFDMFPQTKWCETLVVLSKKIPASHINIDVEFGEGEGQFSLKNVAKRAEARKPKEKVTYKMIQDYIEQTYGFKVHTAYIAEVKRDLGLPMYDAPNAVEELKRPRAHPTPRMVEAIKETLKHFEIT